jgi:hypothetical protein
MQLIEAHASVAQGREKHDGPLVSYERQDLADRPAAFRGMLVGGARVDVCHGASLTQAAADPISHICRFVASTRYKIAFPGLI